MDFLINETYWQEQRYEAIRKLSAAEIMLANFALKQSGQLSLFDESDIVPP